MPRRKVAETILPKLFLHNRLDVVGALVDSKDYLTARKYWNKLKQRLREEGNETVTNCHQLKLTAADGKMRLTDVADQQQLFRLIQSIPSPKAEPFKLWMAQVASNRIDQIRNPGFHHLG